MDTDSESVSIWSELDFDGDGRLAVSDAADWLFHFLFLPGDLAVDFLIGIPVIAPLLGIDADSYGGVASKTVSVMFWIVVLIIVGWLWTAIRDLDRAATAWISRNWEDLKRRLRVARRRVTSWVGLKLQQRRARRETLDVGEFQLETLESAVLHCYAGLTEDKILATTDVTSALSISLADARKAHYALVKYRFLQPAVGTDNASPAYQITRAGQLYLMER